MVLMLMGMCMLPLHRKHVMTTTTTTMMMVVVVLW